MSFASCSSEVIFWHQSACLQAGYPERLRTPYDEISGGPLAPCKPAVQGNGGPRGQGTALNIFFQRQTVACFVTFYFGGTQQRAFENLMENLSRGCHQNKALRSHVLFFCGGAIYDVP